MSLINDALKRASQSDKNRPAQAPLPLPMQPAPPASRDGNSASLLIAVTIVAVVGIVVSALLFLGSRIATTPMVARVPATPVMKSITVSPAPNPQPAPAIKKTLPPPAAPAPLPVVRAAPVPIAAPPVAPPETFPTNLTLKAIFYNKTNPRALVNGKTVETGDKIGDVLVTGIMSDRVFLDWKGQSKVLMMGGQ